MENSEEEHGQEDYVWKVQASKLTLEGWSRKRGLGSGNPSLVSKHTMSCAGVEAHYQSTWRIDLEGPRVWQTLGAWWEQKIRVGQTLRWGKGPCESVVFTIVL